METESEVSKVVEALGGVSQASDKKPFAETILRDFISKQKVELDPDFLFFTQHFGGKYFSNSIEYIPKDAVPIAKMGNVCSVGTIYGWDESEDSIPSILDRYSDQFPKGYLPFADGASGDFLCLKMKGKDAGSIWYWHHESPEGEDLYFIANDFSGLMKLFRVGEEEKLDTSGYVGEEISPDDDFWKQF